MKIDDFLKEEMNWSDRDLEYRPVIGYLKVTELLQKWGKKQLLLHDVSQQRELLAFRKWQKDNWKDVYLYSNEFMIREFKKANCG